MERLVRPVVVPADHVRDPEVDVVHHARQVIGGRAVLANEGRAVEALAELRGGLELAFAAVALPDGSLLPLEPEPLEVAQQLLLPPGTLRAGSVSSIRSSSQSPNARLATALSAFPTWSDPVGLGAKRTRFMAPL